MVSNAYGIAVSSNAVLTVLLPPAIITQPSNQTVVAGANANFCVQATSAAPLNYQWDFDQTNLLAGADAPTLSLANVQPAQAGDYSVVMNNIAGSVTSAVATLTVLVPTGILIAPALLGRRSVPIQPGGRGRQQLCHGSLDQFDRLGTAGNQHLAVHLYRYER